MEKLICRNSTLASFPQYTDDPPIHLMMIIFVQLPNSALHCFVCDGPEVNCFLLSWGMCCCSLQRLDSSTCRQPPNCNAPDSRQSRLLCFY